MECFGCKMFEVWSFLYIEYSRCGMLGMSNVRDMGFSLYGMFNCEVIEMRCVLGVGYMRCAMLGI